MVSPSVRVVAMDRPWEFPDRMAAGRQLGVAVAGYLCQYGVDVSGVPLVLGLPRGGVPVAAQVAHAVGGELDVLVARKIGAPTQPELGVGAVTDHGAPVWNTNLLRQLGLTPDDLADEVAGERVECRRRARRYRGNRPPPRVADRTVIVVDDGLATGITARAAVRALRPQHPTRLVFAAPVCARGSARDLAEETDAIVCVCTPPRLVAVGRWYGAFEQLTDEQVEHALGQARRLRGPTDRWRVGLGRPPTG